MLKKFLTKYLRLRLGSRTSSRDFESFCALLARKQAELLPFWRRPVVHIPIDLLDACRIVLSEIDDGKLVQRELDDPDVTRDRINAFFNSTKILREFVKQRSKRSTM